MEQGANRGGRSEAGHGGIVENQERLRAPYTFQEEVIGVNDPWSFSPAFFNTPAYLAHCEGLRLLTCVIRRVADAHICGAVHFHLDEARAISPGRAPFGSVDFDPRLNPRVVDAFLEFVETQLRARRLAEVQLTNPPSLRVRSHIPVLETLLVNRGFSVVNAELTTVIEVTDMPFSEIIQNTERPRLRRAGVRLESAQLEATHMEEVYDRLAAWHALKGYRVSAGVDYLSGMVRRFPDRYILFGVRDGADMVAACVGIHVSPGVFYNFFMNHDPAYDALSPARVLMEVVYQYCQHHDIRYFDLGTSALDGQPNFSLLDFKRHMGGVHVSKFTFRKSLL